MTGDMPPRTRSAYLVGELADHLGCHDRVAGVDVAVFRVAAEPGAGFLHGRGAAQFGGGVEGVGVGDAGQPEFGAGGVHDDTGAVGPHRPRSCASPWATVMI